MADQYFRAGVGLVVVSRDGQVLALERTRPSGSWQTPQGGLDPGEEPLDAASRELLEEAGIPWSLVEIVAELPGWVTYELPPPLRSDKTGRGQAQHWYLLRFLGRDDDIRLDGSAEFASWRWMPVDDLLSLVWDVKRPVYELWADAWRPLIEATGSVRQRP